MRSGSTHEVPFTNLLISISTLKVKANYKEPTVKLGGLLFTRPPSVLTPAASLVVLKTTLRFGGLLEGLTELTESCCTAHCRERIRTEIRQGQRHVG